MGTDAKISLPANVRVDDVADVLGALFGLKPERRDFSTGGGWSTHVEGVGVGVTTMPEMARIELTDCPVFNGRHVNIFYHFESEGGRRLVMHGSFGVWIAAFKRLADFFGGVVDYSDCDDVDADYTIPDKPDAENHASDGAEWYDLQARKLEVVPLTKEEIAACVEFAAYQE